MPELSLEAYERLLHLIFAPIAVAS